jgi:DNA polymerase alpha-associated DNA helicase A
VSGLTIWFYFRGSKFLKKWMEFLEENADLRYPDISTLSQEA